jgi:uncharacterized membrane protein YqjE
MPVVTTWRTYGVVVAPTVFFYTVGSVMSLWKLKNLHHKN